MTYEEARDSIRESMRRLMDIENVIVTSATELDFPDRNELMPLMDGLQRAHYQLDRVLQIEEIGENE
ncbi:hypothetical protein ACWEV3_10360 [Saccharopolyspora sp. NPDC003752]